MSSRGSRFDDDMQASVITAVPSAPPKFISGEVRRLPGELSDAEQMANTVVQPCNFKLLAERGDVRQDNDLGAILVPQQTANDRLRLLSISGGTFNGGFQDNINLWLPASLTKPKYDRKWLKFLIFSGNFDSSFANISRFRSLFSGVFWLRLVG